MAVSPRRPPTAQEFVLGEVRRMIAAGNLRAGEQIKQDALAEQLGTSRVPLREALKILEGEGQVTYHPHRGYFVANLSADDLIEVYRIRQLLEDEAVSRAIPLLTEHDLAELAIAMAEVEAAGERGDVPAMTASNRRFHFILIERAGMPRLTRLIRQLWDATDAYRAMYFAEPVNRIQVDREHRQILDALNERDIPRSIALLNTHRDHAVRRVTKALVR